MPVFGVNDKLIAALALTGPISRLTEDRREQGISQLMHATASRLSQKMGPVSLLPAVLWGNAGYCGRVSKHKAGRASRFCYV